jgi:hypothetical protein
MTIYCLRCKTKKEIADDKVEIGEFEVNGKKRRIARAVCPDCGMKMNKFLKAE